MAPDLTADDRFAILDLMARYAWAIDTGDVEAYVACFSPDAVLSMRGVPNRGHDAIRTYVTGVENRPDFPGRQHHHDEVRIEGDGERCSVKSYSTISQRFEDGETKIVFAGIYRDVVVKLDERWLFAERHWDVWDKSKLESYRA
jgi:uncharacterized protein (TIGR02246 family)